MPNKPVEDRTPLLAPPVLDPDEDGWADEDAAPGEDEEEEGEEEEEESHAPVDDAKPVDDADADTELVPKPVEDRPLLLLDQAEEEEEEGSAPVDDAEPVEDADADADPDPELEPEPVLAGTVTLTVTLMAKSGTFHEYELSETAEVFRIHTLTLPLPAATMSNWYEMLEAESCEALILRQLEHTTSLEKSKPVTAYVQSRKRVKAVVALSKVMPFTED